MSAWTTAWLVSLMMGGTGLVVAVDALREMRDAKHEEIRRSAQAGLKKRRW